MTEMAFGGIIKRIAGRKNCVRFRGKMFNNRIFQFFFIAPPKSLVPYTEALSEKIITVRQALDKNNNSF